jgi:hypothetical protein
MAAIYLVAVLIACAGAQFPQFGQSGGLGGLFGQGGFFGGQGTQTGFGAGLSSQGDQAGAPPNGTLLRDFFYEQISGLLY